MGGHRAPELVDQGHWFQRCDSLDTLSDGKLHPEVIGPGDVAGGVERIAGLLQHCLQPLGGDREGLIFPGLENVGVHPSPSRR